MTVQEGKAKFLEFIFNLPKYKRMVNTNLLLTRCPYCGDSRSNFNTGHLYIWVEPTSDRKMGFVCHKCKEHGVVSSELITLLGGDNSLLDAIGEINKKGISSKADSIERQFKYFDVKLPDKLRQPYKRKVDYIESRLDIKMDWDKMNELKVITSIYDFLTLNEITTPMFKPELMNVLERDYVGFLSVGNSHIICRDVTCSHMEPWMKYPIFPDSVNNGVMFAYNTELDVFSSEEMSINLSEGVFDAVGIKEYFHKNENSLDIAMCGKNYHATIKYLASIGLFGSNITLNFYMDNDKQFNKGRDNELPESVITIAKALFGKASIIHNMKGKDYGVKKDEIILNRKFL